MLSSWDTEHFPSISFVINTGAIAPGGLALNLYVGAALEMDILLGYCSAAAHWPRTIVGGDASEYSDYFFFLL